PLPLSPHCALPRFPRAVPVERRRGRAHRAPRRPARRREPAVHGGRRRARHPHLLQRRRDPAPHLQGVSVSPDPRDRTGADTPQDQTPAAVDPDVAETGPPAPTDATADAGRTDDGRTTDTPVAETSSDDAPAPDEDVPADGSAPDDAREAADAATEPADEAADAVGTAATEPDAPAPAQEPAPTGPDDADTDRKST